MILSTAAAASPFPRVFMIYAGFWVVVILGLLFWVGVLLKRQEKALRERKGTGSHDSH